MPPGEGAGEGEGEDKEEGESEGEASLGGGTILSLFAGVTLVWHFLLQLWYLLGVGDWKLLARCGAVVKNRKGQGRWGGRKSLLNTWKKQECSPVVHLPKASWPRIVTD